MKFMPRKFIYFATLHLIAKTTTGKHSNTVVIEFTVIDAVKRFAEDNGI